MLKEVRRHYKSQSCCNLQREISKQYKQSPFKKKQFIPFCAERRLGRIINESQQRTNKITNDQLIAKINFRNFQKIYKSVLAYEDRKYSSLTRKSEQKNILNREWKKNSISKLPIPQLTSKPCLQNFDQESLKKEDRYEKVNLQLYKKLSLIKQPKNNPQLQQMYDNYIQICQLNQNIRRKDALFKQKAFIL